LAVLDADSVVRQRVLAGFRKLPGAVEILEIEPALNDRNPVVQMELIELIQAKGLKVTENVKESLRNSLDPDVAKRALAIQS
jgi:hypothetical protein